MNPSINAPSRALLFALGLITCLVAQATAQQATAQDPRSITDFGAVPDDGQGDHAAIQAALDSLAPGEVLQFPPGTFDVSQTLTIRTADVKLKGASQSESILKATGDDPHVGIQLAATARNARLESFTLDGDNSTAISQGVSVRTNGVRIEGVTIRNLNGEGFNHAIHALSASDLQVTNCAMENIHPNAKFSAGISFQGSNGRFIGNTIRRTGRQGIFVGPVSDVGSSDIVIRGNTIEESGLSSEAAGAAIELGPHTERAVVADNIVDKAVRISAQTSGLAIRNNRIRAASFIAGSGMTNSVIAGNTIAADEVIPPAKVSIASARRVLVLGNHIAGNQPNASRTPLGFKANSRSVLSVTASSGDAEGDTHFVGQPVKFDRKFADPSLSDAAVARLWDFSTGLPSTDASPTFTYDKPGEYLVTAAAWDGAGRGVFAQKSLIILLAGDYNRDGRVDRDDYQVWRATSGQTVTPRTAGDGNGDGKVNAADYTIWRNAMQ